MQNIFLTQEPPNGRPREIGTFVAEEGKHGFFAGYDDQQRRVIIKSEDLNRLILAAHQDYEIKIIIAAKKSLMEKAKEKILLGIQNALQPKSA